MTDKRALPSADGAAAADAALLGDFLDAARGFAPQPSAALVARVQAEALAGLPRVRAPLRPRGLWSRLAALAGGWPGLGGMAAATLAGVWIGFSGAGGLGELTFALVGAGDGTMVELLPEGDEFVFLAGGEG